MNRLIFAFVVLSLVSCAAGQLTPEPLEDVKKLISQERLFKVDKNSDDLKIESRFKNATVSARANYRIKTNGIPTISTEFCRDSNVASGSGFKLRLTLLGVAEINDSRNITLSSATNYVRFIKSKAKWSDIASANVTGDNGVAINKVTTTYANNTWSQNGSIALDVYVTPENTTYHGMTLKPNSIKFGVTISQWPYSYSDSRLAIVMGLYTGSSMKHDWHPSDRTLSVSNGQGSFNWTSSVDYTSGSTTTTGTITAESAILSDTNQAGVTVKSGDDSDMKPEDKVSVMVFKTQVGQFQTIAWDPELATNDDAITTASSPDGSSTSAAVPSPSASLGWTAAFVLGCLVLQML